MKKLTEAQVRGILEQINGGELNHDQLAELTLMLMDSADAECDE